MLKKIIIDILIIFFLCKNTFANISIIRDTEIENFIKELIKPILKTANLNEEDINIFIVDDNSINAFVANGQNIFINIGLFTNLDTPDSIVGILAHEIGHISAGHLIRFNENIKNKQKVSVGSILIGIGSLLAGLPELGQTLILGSIGAQQQAFLKYSRQQEEVADSLAVQYLQNNNISVSSLLNSMNKFYLNELEYPNNIEYFLTHPLSRHRKEFLENFLKKEKFDNNNYNNLYKDKFNFIRAKILAYKNNNKLKLNIDKNSDYYIYFKSIVNMRQNDYINSIKQINYLLNKYKNNPYFYELLGDIYLKQNNVKLALSNYIMSDKFHTNNTLIKQMISYIIIKYKQNKLYDIAINNLYFILHEAKIKDPINFKLLAELYYDKNELALSYLNMAKYYEYKENNKKYKKLINENLELAKQNTNDENILKQIEDFELTK